MRRNMQEVLERWGRWAASEEYCSLVDWPALSVTPYGTPEPKRSKPGCSDEDGAAIDACVAHMGMMRGADDLLILGQRFIGGHSLRHIADATGENVHGVRTSLAASEAFLEGCLAMLGIRLDMDPEVLESEPVVCAQKHVLCF
ncbi:antiterminator Q family protein [Serratia oryzae]|uniref:Antitermination protein Q n=1 Tax=Serratia oryzae TaxID=2034155 RepID=A0A1S8CPS7_9GAMM|nr:antiterminator Q family protein [Serratia oryzae]OMQ26890.1 antitermination protein Q [Serratia oryzae]